jgi:hypothetical protein
VTAADNDGTTTATSTTTSTLENPLSPLPGQATSLPSGAATGTNTSPQIAGSGTPNGTPASETATLQINGPAPTTRTFGQHAFKLTGYFADQAITLTGRLINSQSQPITDATLDVLQQPPAQAHPSAVSPRVQREPSRSPSQQDPPARSRSPTAHTPTTRTTPRPLRSTRPPTQPRNSKSTSTREPQPAESSPTPTRQPQQAKSSSAAK